MAVISINTNILKREGLSLGEFLSMLLPFYGERYSKCYSLLTKKGLASKSKSNIKDLELDYNQKDRVERILTMSCPALRDAKVKDFEALATCLQMLYPYGEKERGLDWRGRAHEVAQRLRELYLYADFDFTEEEAINATKEYVNSFGSDRKYMMVLENFIEKRDEDDNIVSQFMTIIENNRENEDS